MYRTLTSKFEDLWKFVCRLQIEKKKLIISSKKIRAVCSCIRCKILGSYHHIHMSLLNYSYRPPREVWRKKDTKGKNMLPHSLQNITFKKLMNITVYTILVHRCKFTIMDIITVTFLWQYCPLFFISPVFPSQELVHEEIEVSRR